MKKIKVVFLRTVGLAGLCILGLSSLTEALKAFPFNPLNLPPPPTPAQFVDGMKSNFESFITILKRDIELVKDMNGSEFKNRVEELKNFAEKQKLNAAHIWLPFMNESDNTLVQVFMPPPPVLSPTAAVAFAMGQVYAQMLRYKIRPLTPLEFVAFSGRMAFDTVLFQGIINFVPEDAKINGFPVREFLTEMVKVTWVALPVVMLLIATFPFMIMTTETPHYWWN